MWNGIKEFLVWATLAVTPISETKAIDFVEQNNLQFLWRNLKNELFQSLGRDNFNGAPVLHNNEEHEILSSIDSKIVIDAALSYFDEEVKLYSLKWESREKVKAILVDYFSVHPILKKNSKWEILFVIDNKSQFTAMIKNLANTLFDWMPRFIREIAVLIAFWWNEELQKTLNNLDYTVMNLPLKQYRDIVFDYFGWIVKRVASSTNLKISVRDYYSTVYWYYPNKNHERILKELNKTWQFDDDIVDLIYPFRK